MIASLVVIVFSAALLIYWFRYTCILLLRNGTEEVRATTAAIRSNFNFGEVQVRLETASELDPLHASLQRDYQVLTYLVGTLPASSSRASRNACWFGTIG